jgi:hypothetical protein
MIASHHDANGSRLGNTSAVAGYVWSVAAGVLLYGLLRSHQVRSMPPSPAYAWGSLFYPQSASSRNWCLCDNSPVKSSILPTFLAGIFSLFGLHQPLAYRAPATTTVANVAAVALPTSNQSHSQSTNYVPIDLATDTTLVKNSVGINLPKFPTTIPVNALDVEGGVAIGSPYAGTSTAPSNGLLVSGNVGIGTTTPYSRLTVWGPDNAASTTAFLVANNASTTEFAVLDNGNATLAGNLIRTPTNVSRRILSRLMRRRRLPQSKRSIQ